MATMGRYSEQEDEVVLEYGIGLDSLTNQKAAINALSSIARENVHAAPGIVSAISSRIENPNLSQEKRITFLYLIDSLVKTSGKISVYSTLFHQRIVQLFCSSYNQSSVANRKLLVRLYDTWDGVFDESVLTSINQQLNLDMQRIIISDKNVRPGVNVEDLDRRVAEDKSRLINRSLFEPCDIRDEQALAKLYGAKPLQCNKCGIRFREDQRGVFANHLDFHFYFDSRIEAADNSTSTSYSRRWYMSREDWIADTVGDFKDEVNKALTSFKGIFDDGIEDEVGSEAEEQAVHAAFTDDVISCPVCNEKFEMFWEEDEDVWKLKNSIKREDGRIYHTHCAVDAPMNISNPMKISKGIEVQPKSIYDNSVIIQGYRKRKRF